MEEQTNVVPELTANTSSPADVAPSQGCELRPVAHQSAEMPANAGLSSIADTEWSELYASGTVLASQACCLTTSLGSVSCKAKVSAAFPSSQLPRTATAARARAQGGPSFAYHLVCPPPCPPTRRQSPAADLHTHLPWMHGSDLFSRRASATVTPLRGVPPARVAIRFQRWGVAIQVRRPEFHRHRSLVWHGGGGGRRRGGRDTRWVRVGVGCGSCRAVAIRHACWGGFRGAGRDTGCGWAGVGSSVWVAHQFRS